MLRRGTRRLAATDHPDLDERDAGARDQAFRLAYPMLMVVVAGTLSGVVIAGESVDLGSLRDTLLWIALWWAFLPTGVLAWREPDGLPTHPDTLPVLGEPARDALFGLTLAVAMTLALLLSAGAWALLPLVAVRALFGTLAWRGSGRPLVEPARIGGLAFALVLFGVVLVVVLTTDSGEGSETGVWAVAAGLIAAGLALGVFAARRS